MSINAHNEIKTVLTAAVRFKAKLPTDVEAKARHALSLHNDLTTASVADVTKELLELLGDPAAFDKALPDALIQVARAEALTKLRTQVVDQAVNRARQRMAAEREAVTAAFGKALAPYIATLTQNAGNLEPTFDPRYLDDLSNQQFAAWKECAPALEAIEAAASALRWMYSINPDNILNPQVVARLPFVSLPESLPDLKTTAAFVDSIDGRRVHGGTFTRPTADLHSFWPSRVIHAGGSLAFAGPAETQQRAARLRASHVDREVAA